MKFLFLFFLFVFPFILLSLPGIPQWLERTIAVSIFIFLMTAGVFWYGLSPKSKIIRASGKLSQPQYDNVRPTIERSLRILTILFGVFVCVYLTFPWCVDLARLARGGKPLRIAGTVKHKSVPLFGLWFVEQTVRVSQETNQTNRNYYLYYSLKPFRVGETYELVVLPRSRVIVEFREASREPIGKVSEYDQDSEQVSWEAPFSLVPASGPLT